MYTFSIVIPCFNEEQNIEKIFIKIKKNLINYKSYRVIYVDDGSTDNSWREIVKLKIKYKNILGIKLSKNFGKENAITAGINQIEKKEKFCIIIDSDLQHPVEKIKELIKSWKNGYHVVNTHRIDNSEGILREFFSITFYFLIKKFSNINYNFKTTDFMLIDLKVVAEYKKFREKNKSFRTLINWMGFKRKSIPITINKRLHGNSKFSTQTLISFAINSLSSFSIIPLKVSGYMGLLMMIISFVSLISCLIINYLNLNYISTQTLIIILNTLMTGTILTSIGFMGIYLSKTLDNSSKRPDYIIDEITGK
jgi:dolichol-phosphate mannosyltransferase